MADRSVARPQPMSTPPTQYAKSGDASIAYQVVGDGPIDLVLVLGFATHLELQWEAPPFARFFERISSFSRLIIFDKRGTGLSDPVTEVPTLEQRIDDVRAVMDAAGSERAALFGISEGGPMSVLFAATHPERVTALVLHGAMGRTTEAPDYPWAVARGGASRVRRRVHRPLLGATGRGDGRALRSELRGRSPGGGVHRPSGALRRESGDGPADLRDVPGHRRASHPAHDPRSDARPPPARRPGRQSTRRQGARRADPGRPIRGASRDRPCALGRRLGSRARGDRGVPDRRPLGSRARPRARHGDVHGHRRLDGASGGVRGRALARAARSASGSGAARADAVPRTRGEDAGRRLPRHLRRPGAGDPMRAARSRRRPAPSAWRCASACTAARSS